MTINITKKEIWAAAVSCATCALMIGTILHLKKTVSSSYRLYTEKITRSTQEHVQDTIDSHSQGLKNITRLYASLPKVTDAEFKTSAVSVLNNNAGLVAVNFVDRDFIVKQVYPYAPGQSTIGLNLKTRLDVLSAANKAINTKDITATNLIDLAQGGKGIHLYSPIFRENRWMGFIEGTLKMLHFSQFCLEKAIDAHFRFTVIDETSGREIHTTLQPQSRHSFMYDTYFTIRVGDRLWWIILHSLTPPLILVPIILLLMLELIIGAWIVRYIWLKQLPR